jgi:hypothetical protein
MERMEWNRKSFRNENTCDVFMNELRMEDEPL